MALLSGFLCFFHWRNLVNPYMELFTTFMIQRWRKPLKCAHILHSWILYIFRLYFFVYTKIENKYMISKNFNSQKYNFLFTNSKNRFANSELRCANSNPVNNCLVVIIRNAVTHHILKFCEKMVRLKSE